MQVRLSTHTLGQSRIHEAAQIGDKQTLQLLLHDQGGQSASGEELAGAFAPDKLGRTPLYLAAERGDADCLKILWGHGDPLTRDPQFQRSLLHLAAEAEDSGALEWLLQQELPEPIWKADNWGQSPLHRACIKGRWRATQLLLLHPRVQALLEPDREGRTPLHHAIALPCSNCVQAILEHSLGSHCWIQDTCGLSPIHLAFVGEDDKVLEALLQHAPMDRDLLPPDIISRTPLHQATLGKQGRLLQVLLKAPVMQASLRQRFHDKDSANRSALCISAKVKDLDSFQALINAMPDAQLDSHLLHFIGGTRRVEFLKAYLESPLLSTMEEALAIRDRQKQCLSLETLSNAQLQFLSEFEATPESARILGQTRLWVRKGAFEAAIKAWGPAIKKPTLVQAALAYPDITRFLRHCFPEAIARAVKELELAPNETEEVLDLLSDADLASAVSLWSPPTLIRLSQQTVPLKRGEKGVDATALEILQFLGMGSFAELASNLRPAPLAALCRLEEGRPVVRAALMHLPPDLQRVAKICLGTPLARQIAPKPQPKPKHYYLGPEGRLPPLRQAVLQEQGWVQSETEWSCWLPESHHDLEQQVKKLSLPETGVNLNVLPGPQAVFHKESLFPCLSAAYGWEDASELSPRTYSLREKSDRERLKQDFRDGDIYILKNNRHKKRGLSLKDKLEDILDPETRKEFLIAQKLIRNAYQLEQHPTVLRRYLLLEAKDGELRGFLHVLGLCNVTKDPLDGSTWTLDTVTTTSEQPPSLFRRFPGTLHQLGEHLQRSHYSLPELESAIRELLRKVLAAIVAHDVPVGSPHCMELFGLDILLEPKSGPNGPWLKPWLVEINRGPDITPKESRPYVYTEVVRDLYRCLEKGPELNEGFRAI